MNWPPIYVTTLSDQYYRRTATQKVFDRQGLKVQWFEGINGTAAGIRPAVAHEYNPDGTAIYVATKVLAIALSHVTLLQHAILNGDPEFFVMEDDVVLHTQFSDRWEKVRNHVPDEIGIVQCAVTCHEDKPSEPINEYLEHRYYPFCCTCNWWRRESAMFALKVLFPLNSPIDVILADRVFPFLGHAITRERLAWDKSVMSKDGKWPSTYPSAFENMKR